MNFGVRKRSAVVLEILIVEIVIEHGNHGRLLLLRIDKLDHSVLNQIRPAVPNNVAYRWVPLFRCVEPKVALFRIFLVPLKLV